MKNTGQARPLLSPHLGLRTSCVRALWVKSEHPLYEVDRSGVCSLLVLLQVWLHSAFSQDTDSSWDINLIHKGLRKGPRRRSANASFQT